LKYCGLALVIAGSFSETYKRNAINNGFLALEAPDLVKDLLDDYGREILTVATDIEATIHFSNSSINYNGKMYSLSPVGIDAQALFLSEGLENWVKERLT
jgi:homoaconitate hydratase